LSASSSTASAPRIETDPEPPARAAPPSPADVEELERAVAFRVALRRFLRRIEDAAAAAALSPQRYHLLLMIRAAPAQPTVTDLCELLQLPEGATSELVRRTEAAGLIVRERSPDDGRVFLFSLTEEGDRRLMTAFRALRADSEEVLDDFRALDRRLRASLADYAPASASETSGRHV
jgi:DNA-binding MarR family transcriptional regulator